MPAIGRIAAKALVLLAGWLVASLAPLAAVAAVEELRRQRLRAGTDDGDARPPAQRRPDDRARVRGGGADRASVDRRDPHAQRDRRHLDPQLRRGGPGRLLGAHRRLHAAGDGRGVSAWPDPARRRAHRGRADRLPASAFAALWLRLGDAGAAARAGIASCSRAVAALVSSAAASAGASWDLVREPDELVPRGRRGSARDRFASRSSIEVHLAPEDPRRADLDRKAIAKLRRVLPALHVRYVSATSIGLFEQTAPHYGEIWYELGGKKEMSRATTAESALETIYDLAGVKPPAERRRHLPRASARGRAQRAPPPCSTASGRRSSWSVHLLVRRRQS